MGIDRRSFGGFLLGTASTYLTSPQSLFAATYPEKPITFICPWPAGGTADQTMRALCSAAAKDLG